MFQHSQNVPVENTELVDTTLSSKKVQLENPELNPAGNAQTQRLSRAFSEQSCTIFSHARRFVLCSLGYTF